LAIVARIALMAIPVPDDKAGVRGGRYSFAMV
jgi:hypothetical protein